MVPLVRSDATSLRQRMLHLLQRHPGSRFPGPHPCSGTSMMADLAQATPSLAATLDQPDSPGGQQHINRGVPALSEVRLVPPVRRPPGRPASRRGGRHDDHTCLNYCAVNERVSSTIAGGRTASHLQVDTRSRSQRFAHDRRFVSAASWWMPTW
jgi:hypothetical protein